MISIKQQFIRFLKENNAYEPFLTNFEKREEKRNKVCPKRQYLKKMEPEDFIDRAFDWKNTKEGWKYWFNLSIEWQRIFDKIKYYDFD